MKCVYSVEISKIARRYEKGTHPDRSLLITIFRFEVHHFLLWYGFKSSMAPNGAKFLIDSIGPESVIVNLIEVSSFFGVAGKSDTIFKCHVCSLSLSTNFIGPYPLAVTIRRSYTVRRKSFPPSNRIHSCECVLLPSQNFWDNLTPISTSLYFLEFCCADLRSSCEYSRPVTWGSQFCNLQSYR